MAKVRVYELAKEWGSIVKINYSSSELDVDVKPYE